MIQLARTSILLISVILLAGFSGYLSYSYFKAQDQISKLEDERNLVADQYEDLQNNHSSLNDIYSLLLQNHSELMEEKLNSNQTYQVLLNEHLSLEETYLSLLEEKDSLLINLNESLIRLEEANNALAQKNNYSDFERLVDLESWLHFDNTSDNEYVADSYDCDDFAIDLMVSAFNSGYIIGTTPAYITSDLEWIEVNGTYYKVSISYHIESNYKGLDNDDYYVFGNHMANLAYVTDRGWVLIEPSMDWVFPLETHEL
jgi:hypothetical protein